MDDLNSSQLSELLEALGAHLEAAGAVASIVVVGGSALAVRGWVDRTTRDVDVIARAEDRGGERVLLPAAPLPEALVDAIRRVAEDYRLPEDWMNTAIDAQWAFGLPPGFGSEVAWSTFGPLTVGFAGRSSLIALKLFAAADAGRKSVHHQDLLALQPTAEELALARAWVLEQDAGPEFPAIVEEAISDVLRDLRRSRPTG